MIELTGYNWTITVDDARKGSIYGIDKKLKIEKQNKDLLNHDLIKKITEIFPELEINDITDD